MAAASATRRSATARQSPRISGTASSRPSAPRRFTHISNDGQHVEEIMSENKPLKIMYLNPLASSASYDSIFADMARDHKLPQTEVHVASLPESEGGFTHIEF